MPDGAPTPTQPSTGERAADIADAGLIRRVRRNLVLWSGGTTLVVLLVLAVALYLAVAGSLASSGVDQLEDAMAVPRAVLTGQRPDPGDTSPYELQLGSPTFAFALDENDRVFAGPRGFRMPAGLPDEDAVTEARASGSDLRTATVGTNEVPVRILTEAVETQQGQQVVIQVVGDRTTEVQTLQAMLVVLIVGGVVVVLVAFGFGAVYARRALVPIRESLASQRSALRRQRDFAADASHELRTPLTVVRSSVEHLNRHQDQPVREVGSALDDIDAEVRHMTAMVEDLLLLARSDSGAVALDRVPVDLGDVAADGASALAKPAADGGVTISVDPQPAVVTGDPARLRQLVMILVDNAIRHTPSGGHVSVAVRSDATGATLTVEDDGPGIRPEDLPHVFERFYRAPGAPGGGTGLGLAIAHWIVERHGGRIAVANRPTGGAAFAVRLPSDGGQPRAVAAPVPETR
jgi:signal transduction histidine kinase